MRKMSVGEQCICGSGKKWGSCCGRDLRDKNAHAIYRSLTGQTSIRFVLVRFFGGSKPTNPEAFTDDDGNVIVFTTRSQAMACNESLRSAYVVMGMSEAKWAKFQQDIPKHTVITDAVA